MSKARIEQSTSAVFITRMKSNDFLNSELNWFNRLPCTIRHFAARSDILCESKTVEALTIVVDGWAARCKQLEDGERQISALFVPGDICNLDGMLGDSSRFTVTALTACVVAAFPIAEVRAKIQRSPEHWSVLWRLLMRESAVLTEWLVGVGQRSTRQRLAHLLCELQTRLQAVGLSEADAYPLPLTQQDFGEALGVSTVHVNRTLQSFRNENLIIFRNGHLRVQNVCALRELADFNPQYLGLK